MYPRLGQWLVVTTISVIHGLTGCASTKMVNPSFRITQANAEQAVNEMRANPKALVRPLVVVGGFMDPNISPPLFTGYFQRVTGDERIVPVSIGLCTSFDQCRQRIIAAVDAAFPSDDPRWTTEVDVVGASLGGLAARYAAAPSNDPTKLRRLRISRLFTISSPHIGAALAAKVRLIDFHRDMRPGSDFLSRVGAADTQADYLLYPYVMLGDEIVGEHFTAPLGVNPFWLPKPWLISPHFAAMIDARILGDISRRLRSEEPFTREPATELPAE
jgi:hypothetical protein